MSSLALYESACPRAIYGTLASGEAPHAVRRTVATATVAGYGRCWCGDPLRTRRVAELPLDPAVVLGGETMPVAGAVGAAGVTFVRDNGTAWTARDVGKHGLREWVPAHDPDGARTAWAAARDEITAALRAAAERDAQARVYEGACPSLCRAVASGASVNGLSHDVVRLPSASQAAATKWGCRCGSALRVRPVVGSDEAVLGGGGNVLPTPAARGATWVSSTGEAYEHDLEWRAAHDPDYVRTAWRSARADIVARAVTWEDARAEGDTVVEGACLHAVTQALAGRTLGGHDIVRDLVSAAFAAQLVSGRTSWACDCGAPMRVRVASQPPVDWFFGALFATPPFAATRIGTVYIGPEHVYERTPKGWTRVGDAGLAVALHRRWVDLQRSIAASLHDAVAAPPAAAPSAPEAQTPPEQAGPRGDPARYLVVQACPRMTPTDVGHWVARTVASAPLPIATQCGCGARPSLATRALAPDERLPLLGGVPGPPPPTHARVGDRYIETSSRVVWHAVPAYGLVEGVQWQPENDPALRLEWARVRTEIVEAFRACGWLDRALPPGDFGALDGLRPAAAAPPDAVKIWPELWATERPERAQKEEQAMAKTETLPQGDAPRPTDPVIPTRRAQLAQFGAQLGDDATAAAWRTAGSQFVKLAREPLVAVLSRHLAPDDPSMRARVAAFLATDVGAALLASLLSLGLSAVPGDPMVTGALARELRVRAMAGAGDLIADVVLGPLREVTATFLRDMPAAVAEATAGVAEPSGVRAVHDEAPQGLDAPGPRLAAVQAASDGDPQYAAAAPRARSQP